MKQTYSFHYIRALLNLKTNITYFFNTGRTVVGGCTGTGCELDLPALDTRECRNALMRCKKRLGNSTFIEDIRE